MGNNMRFLYNNLFDLAALTASSEESEFPASNIQHIWHTFHWRSEDDSSEWLKWNFGATKDITDLVIKYHNFQVGATVYIQADDDPPNWGDPPLNTQLTVTADQIVKNWSSPQAYQWWRLTIVDDTNPDTYLRVGRIFCGGHYEMSINFLFGYVERLLDKSKLNFSLGGQISSVILDRIREMVFAFENINLTDKLALETIFFNSVGKTIPYFLCVNPNNLTNETYYVRNTKDWEIISTPYDSFFNFILEAIEAQ